MGIRPVDAILLAHAADAPIRGRAATFGVQNVFITGRWLEEACAKHGIRLAHSPPVGALDASTLFACLGYPEVTAFDVSAYEGAQVIVNLNVGQVPCEYTASYDVVFDGGTMEHVSNIENFLNNAARMVVPGGTIIHLNPLNGYADHGFFQFSPTFYLDFYETNGWEVQMCQIVSELDCGKFETMPYRRDLYYAESPYDVANWPTMRRATIFVAVRKPLHGNDEPLALPMQFLYANGLEPRRAAQFPKNMQFSLPGITVGMRMRQLVRRLWLKNAKSMLKSGGRPQNTEGGHNE